MAANTITEGDNQEGGLRLKSIAYDVDNLLNDFGVPLLIFGDYGECIFYTLVLNRWL
jgi:hypothetical protein